MIDQKVVDNIWAYGTCKDSGEGRLKVLKEIGFRMQERAEYVILTGCFNPEGMPPVFHALKALLDHFQIDYSLLAKEYCCGWMPLGQPAVIAKNEGDIARSKELSRTFVLENFRQAEALGAKSIVRFCAACEPTYTNCAAATNLELISYTELLDRHFKGGRLDMTVDYYPGCYRFRRRVTNQPVDLAPAVRVLNKIKGLQVNHVDPRLCCYIPPHLEQLADSLTTRTVVTICSGCYGNLRRKLSERGGGEVKMLPEVVLAAMRT